MVVSITAETAAEAYAEMIPRIRTYGVKEDSRNGPVLAFQDPVVLTILNPRARLVLDATRKANPVFHLMESVWMLAGRKDVDFPARYVKNIKKYANGGELLGAYGWRWRHNPLEDQLLSVIRVLKDDPTSRQAVISMWDPDWDLGVEVKSNDRPCNTHIYLRVQDGALNMTVCNRSNDVIWGMLGANVVHMTILQEFLAWALDLELGRYTVFSNNAHFYLEMPRAEEILHSNPSQYDTATCAPMFGPNDDLSVEVFLRDCENFCEGRDTLFATDYLLTCRAVHRTHRDDVLHDIPCPGWAEAVRMWMSARHAK